MNNSRTGHLNYLLVKCRLSFILFLSFITIAGYSVKAKGLAQQMFRTEFRYAPAERSAKKTVLYGEYASVQVYITPYCRSYHLFNLPSYNSLLKVKAGIFCKRMYIAPIISWLVKIKLASQASDDRLFSAITA